jgi:hypothetical protein
LQDWLGVSAFLAAFSALLTYLTRAAPDVTVEPSLLLGPIFALVGPAR